MNLGDANPHRALHNRLTAKDYKPQSKTNHLVSYFLVSFVIKIRQALQEREIIDSLEGYPQILDPYFAEWLKTRYFGNRKF